MEFESDISLSVAKGNDRNELRPIGVVEQSLLRTYSWEDGKPACQNYRGLAEVLAATDRLFRVAGRAKGLMLLTTDGASVPILGASDLAPVLADHVALTILADGKPKGSMLPANHLNAMLRAESFLSVFSVLDYVAEKPVFLEDFALAVPGYNEGNVDWRYLFIGGEPQITDSTDLIERFLDVMDFDSDADRTNTVGAALTIQLRNHWPGGKPIIVTTATKSHAGKDTVLAFAAGDSKQCSISYQATDWALERSAVGVLAPRSRSLGGRKRST